MSGYRPSILTRYVGFGVSCRTVGSLLLLLVIFVAIDIVETRALVGPENRGLFLWYLFKLPA